MSRREQCYCIDETLYKIVVPVFKVDAFGRWVIDHCESVDS